MLFDGALAEHQQASISGLFCRIGLYRDRFADFSDAFAEIIDFLHLIIRLIRPPGPL
jgi:hypothetical protein